MKKTEETESILASLNGIERAKAPADFKMKLDRRLTFIRSEPFSKFYKLAIAAMISLALLNGVLLIKERSWLTELSEDEATLINETYNYETSLY